MAQKIVVLILCKKVSEYSGRLSSYLQERGISAVLICDYHQGYEAEDKEMLAAGYVHLTLGPHIKKPSAWDKAFYYIKDKLSFYDYVYFIEDDVYCSKLETFHQLITHDEKTACDLLTHHMCFKERSLSWPHWHVADSLGIKNKIYSFNPLCRLSARLIKKVLEERDLRSRFIFQEILFAPLAVDNNYEVKQYCSKDTSSMFGRFGAVLKFTEDEINSGRIIHPIKPIYQNESICEGVDKQRSLP